MEQSPCVSDRIGSRGTRLDAAREMTVKDQSGDGDTLCGARAKELRNLIDSANVAMMRPPESRECWNDSTARQENPGTATRQNLTGPLLTSLPRSDLRRAVALFIFPQHALSAIDSALAAWGG